VSTCPESTVRSSEYISWRPRARPRCEPAVNRAGPAAPSPWHPPRHNLRRSLLSSRSSLIGMSRRWTQPPGGLTFLGGSETLPASNRRSGGVKRLGIPQERKAHRRPHSKSAHRQPRSVPWSALGCLQRPRLAVFGEGAEWIGRTDSAATGEIGAAVRSNRTTTNPARREPRP